MLKEASDGDKINDVGTAMVFGAIFAQKTCAGDGTESLLPFLVCHFVTLLHRTSQNIGIHHLDYGNI